VQHKNPVLHKLFSMASINELIKRVEALNMHDIIGEAIEATKDELKIKQQDQMLDGEGKSRKIGRYRNLSYAGRKQLINPKPGFGNVDLKLKGAFQKGIRITVGNDSVGFDSTDEKAPELKQKYGEDNIFGLNKGNASDYSLQTMGPAATKLIKGKITTR
jgi:hypothetical protein